MGADILHLRVKKDYAQQVLQLLLRDDAIESVIDEEEDFELSDEQKAQLDAELENRINGKNDYKNWNDIKGKYGL